MRALTRGSIVLGLAVVLLPWGASKLSMQFQPLPQFPSFQVGNTAPQASSAQAPAMGARDVESSKSGSGTSASAPVEPTNSTARPSDGTQHSTPHAARRLADVAPPAGRQFTPGSKAHAEAIASRIASDDFEKGVAPLARLYFAYFDRVADYEGLDYYMGERDDGTSLASIAEEFAGSAELRLRYGSLDNVAFIDRVYRNVFDAAPDAAQRAYWVGQLDAGMSRGQVMLAFSESGAFRAITGNEVFVTLAYAQALGRAPDPAGFARWVRFLDAGNPREAVIAGLLGSGRATR